MEDPKITAAWLTASFAIASTLVTVISQFVFRFKDNKAKREQEIMIERRSALLKALSVLDHCYSNMSFDGQPPVYPHEWDISEAAYCYERYDRILC